MSFSYEGDFIINNLCYTFRKGKIYCITGENGVGKSTLINLIIGLIHNYEGEISYNNTNIKELDMYNLRSSLIGIVEQEPGLLNETLKSNVTYGLIKNITDDDILQWFNRLNSLDFIKKLQNELECNISEHSINISGGEKQKIALIRALIKNPDIIILDEPTSALDGASIGSLKSLLRDCKKSKITIIITHEDSLVDIADEVLDLGQDNKENTKR